METNTVNEIALIKKRIETAPLPRQVRLRMKGLFSWSTVIFLFIITIFLVGGHEAAFRMVSRTFGSPAKALVDGQRTWTTHSRSGTHQHYGFHIKYPAPTYPHRGNIEVPYNMFISNMPGSEIDIFYYEKLPGYPSIKDDVDAGLMIFMAVLFIGYIAFVVWWVISRRTFMEKGMPVEAVITSVKTGSKGSKTYNIAYKWKDREYIKSTPLKGIGAGTGSILLLIMPDKPDSFAVFTEDYLWDVENWGAV